MRRSSVEEIREYWQERPLGTQYVTDPDIEPGTPEFFEHVRPWMNPYKFPELMPRIEASSPSRP